jgi:hypothetical protein
MPVKEPLRRLPDRRLICSTHEKAVVLTQSQGKEIFREVLRDMIRMLAGTGKLPNENIDFSVVTRAEMISILGGQNKIHSEATLGLTRTDFRADKSQSHRISVVDGMVPNQFKAVCAHEYAHTWLSENVTRELEPHMVEAFCELVAYKLMDSYQCESQKRAFLSNRYTAGRIAALLEADRKYSFDHVVQWMRTGQDRDFKVTETHRMLAVTRTEPVLHNLTPSGRTAVPDRLVLKGISGQRDRRFALINDCTLQTGETGRVRVGSSNVTVNCLAITDRTVRVRLLPSGELRELTMAVD